MLRQSKFLWLYTDNLMIVFVLLALTSASGVDFLAYQPVQQLIWLRKMADTCTEESNVSYSELIQK